MAEENGVAAPSPLELKIIRQIEYYFGDLNLSRDKFLQQKIKEDDGWVGLDVLVTFNRLKALSEDFEVLTGALKKSTAALMEVSEDGKKIRRLKSKPLPEFNKERKDDLKARSIYVKGFPLDVSLDDLMAFFGKTGDTEQIKMRKDVQGKFKSSCFVVYEKPESAKAFLESEETAKYNDAELSRMLKDDYFKKKTDTKKALREEELREKEERKRKRQEEADKEFVKRITKGAILHIKGVPDDLNRDQVKAFFGNYGNVSWAEYDKGDKEGTLRFDCENGASQAMEKAKEAGEGKVMLKEAELECRVLEGDEEIEHWKNIFQSQKDLRDRKRHKHDKSRRKQGFSRRPQGKRKPKGEKDEESEGSESSDDEGEIPTKQDKVDTESSPSKADKPAADEPSAEKMETKDSISEETKSAGKRPVEADSSEKTSEPPVKAAKLDSPE